MALVRTEQLRQWFQDQFTEKGFTDVVVVAGREPVNAGRTVLIHLNPGPGPTVEGRFDQFGLFMVAKGWPNDIDSAEQVAVAFDDIVMNAPNNLVLGDAYILSMFRSSGRPYQATFLGDRDQFQFIGNYEIECATGMR